jgi:hypothetical protein
MALPPLELPPIEERVALLPGGPFACGKGGLELLEAETIRNKDRDSANFSPE